ncbi:MAG: hypothetical protein L6Q37_14235 [Bdellovibrionaceae bacterium]|nr:hypothetical protein [Pseudobdellovibrionaceae bacterium]NUM58229.1 hypothetical protein [Pseudobdellovibrionaceae bacterium]
MEIFKYLYSKGGLLVEGAGNATDLKEFSHLDPNRLRWEGSDGDPRLSHPIEEVIIRDVEFSYSKTVKLSVFQKYYPPN